MKWYEILPWDSEFFDFKVARIINPMMSGDQLASTLDMLRKIKIRLAYWPANAVIKDTDKTLLRYGGKLVATNLTYVAELAKSTSPYADNQVSEYNDSLDREAFIDLAVESGKYSRFNRDANIPKKKFIELYRIWAKKSISRERAKKILVIREATGELAGFITLSGDLDTGRIGLIAVDEQFRNRKYGTALVSSANSWFTQKGYKRSAVITQEDNVAACAVYEKCGYAAEATSHYYHFWL